ncbi:F-type H+-transporting ATPase subunit b [Pseudomonas linyingensis]|uniref:ATP synthase subunit b n=1 Tax=Pseudomonas linyingensis TaxID=915471 RepID=A0A1H7AH51_9PSED|nr:F0F1 ATP synthase subunit delta [Pseudomonas linyingensis]SEJ61240.1 F-type H+-transporting ATPase subunit b [Pseudomonas linyingensis]
MTLDWWTLGLQTINVVILVWLLSHFLFKPVAQIVAARQQEAGRLLDEAAATRTAAEAERQQAVEARQALAAEREAGLKAVEQEVASTREHLLAEVQREIEQQRAQAEAAQAAQRSSARLQAEEQAGALALDIAAHLLARLPDNLRVTAFLDGLVEGLEQLAPAARQSLVDDRQALILRAPRALAEDELQRCRAALRGALGDELRLTPEVEPALIAGLELEGSSVVVRNSFRADLARLQRELSRHDHADA